MKHLDLFSGIGCFALAARWAGIETIGFCEIDPFCQKVLAKNFPDIPVSGDIREMRGTECDLLTAGFPCQPFSVAGKKKGKNDDRYMWPELIRIIRESKPNWIILENVPGIISHLDPILEDLEKEGYAWQAFLIPASAVHAPHKRERLWIIANRDSERCNEWSDNWKKRHVQDDWQQYVTQIQSEWSQFQPITWPTFNTQEWLGFASDATGERLQGEGEFRQSMYPEKDSKWQTINAINDFNNSKFTFNSDCITSEQTDTPSVAKQNAGNSREGCAGQHRPDNAEVNWQENQSAVFRMDDGSSNRLHQNIPLPGVDFCIDGRDRNKALGNALVPQIPYLFMRIIRLINAA